MSFAFLPLFTGDYLKDTRHLTPQKHGIYLLMLMHCWDTKGPLPLDEQEIAAVANCRSADEIDGLRYVLAKYWVRCEDGWYNERCQEEIERAAAISDKRSKAGRKGYQAMSKVLKRMVNQANDEQVPGKSSASASTLTLTLTPTITLTPTSTKSKGPTAFELPPWIPPDSWADFEEMRRKIRKPLTDAARTVNLRKLEQLRDRGFDPKAVLEEAVANSWTGLWEPKTSTAQGSRHSATGQHMATVARDWVNSKERAK